MKKRLWSFFSRFIEHKKMSRNNFKRPQGLVLYFCANDKIIYLGPKRSIETNISNFSCFHNDNGYRPVFPRIIECDKDEEDFLGVHKLFWRLLWNL